jgi:hypothetical protein
MSRARITWCAIWSEAKLLFGTTIITRSHAIVFTIAEMQTWIHPQYNTPTNHEIYLWLMWSDCCHQLIINFNYSSIWNPNCIDFMIKMANDRRVWPFQSQKPIFETINNSVNSLLIDEYFTFILILIIGFSLTFIFILFYFYNHCFNREIVMIFANFFHQLNPSLSLYIHKFSIYSKIRFS